MNFKSILAILFIFACTTFGWFILGTALVVRTDDRSATLGEFVGQGWGPPLVQSHPEAWFQSPAGVRKEISSPPRSSSVKVDLRFEPRKRGLMWYRTYIVDFAGTYEIHNPSPIEQLLYVRFRLPSELGSFENFSFSLGQCLGKIATGRHVGGGGFPAPRQHRTACCNLPNTRHRLLDLHEAASRNPQARIYSKLKERVEMDLYITDSRGIVIFDTSGTIPPASDHSRMLEIYHTLRGNYGARSSRMREEDDASSVMFVAAPIRDETGALLGVVSVYKPQQSLHDFMTETRRVLRGFTFFALAGLLAGGALASRWITAPVRKLTNYVTAVAEGMKPIRPQLASKSMERLAVAFEEMRDSLEGRGAIESYVQALAHEMKSPVSAIRGAVELLDEPIPEAQHRKFLGNIRSETERLARLTEGLLLLSSVEGQKQLTEKSEISLRELLQSVVREAEPLAASLGISIQLDCPQDCVIRGEHSLLRMAAANLLQNAVEFSPAGAEVRVTLRSEDRHAVLEFVDQGPGVPDFAKEKVFQRFYSLPRPRTGRKSTGLGLCLVREAVILHGGSLQIESANPSGTIARIRMPL